MSNVVQMQQKPNIKDVPNSLRRLADDMEAGRESSPEYALMLCEKDSEMTMYLYGDELEIRQVVGILSIAAANLATVE